MQKTAKVAAQKSKVRKVCRKWLEPGHINRGVKAGIIVGSRKTTTWKE